MAQQVDVMQGMRRDYDALLVVSFGGPEGPDDVEPFLDNVLRGLPIKPESRRRIAQRYQSFNGVSPINGQVREFIAALQSELDTRGPALPIYWGNRNWHPLLPDTFRQMQADGIRSALVYVTSVFGSYSGCRKYREDLYEAALVLDHPPALEKLRLGFNHPRFIEAVASRIDDALGQIDSEARAKTPILFTAHSLPESMARHAPYVRQLKETCVLVADALAHRPWELVYQSNNASYGRESWLGPDICDALATVSRDGAQNVVVAPVGFVCDHMEVVIDLDIEAARVATELGLQMVRAKTVGVHPAYLEMVRELIVERIAQPTDRSALGSLGPSPDACAPDCCLSGRPGPAKPALCQTDAPSATS
jgi:protoporphyrin/coproporphyrin ferrochelatase